MLSVEVRAILLALERILYVLLSVLGVAEAVGLKLDAKAVEHSPYAIETIASNGTNTVNHPTHGNAALLAAIQSLTPVTLPDPPPPAYVPPPVEDIAAAVWSYMISQQGPDGYTPNAMAEEWLYTIAHSLSIYSATEGLPDGRQPWYRFVFGEPSTVYSVGYNWSIFPYARPTDPDFSLALVDDTPLSFLQRTQPAYGWTGTGPSGVAQTYIAWKEISPDPRGRWWRSAFDMPASSVQLGPPVWPGLDNVTLGAPVALADGLVVVGPLHGVLVDLTAAPTGGGVWPVGTTFQYYNWGQVGFESDRGDFEPFQWLGFRLAVYVPRTMTVAANAHFRVTRGPVGTVTPFTINSV